MFGLGTHEFFPNPDGPTSFYKHRWIIENIVRNDPNFTSPQRDLLVEKGLDFSALSTWGHIIDQLYTKASDELFNNLKIWIYSAWATQLMNDLSWKNRQMCVTLPMMY